MSLSMQSPTVVIGIGGAGFSMTQRLSQILEKENINRDDFLFMAIDSKEVDEMEEIDYWGEYTVAISWEGDKEWTSKQEEYDYLDKNVRSPSETGGVERNRTAARGLVDDVSNFNKIATRLESKISSFAELHPDADGMNIWIVYALAGGTGSGTAPTTLGVLQSLNEKNFIDQKIKLKGLATVPKLNIDPDSRVTADLDPEAAPNSFAALSELRKLLDTTVTDETEQSIDLELNTEKAELIPGGESKMPLNRNSIDEFYFVGVDEDQLDQDSGKYAEQIEKTAANTILANAMTNENYPVIADDILRSANFGEYRFPYEEAISYIVQEEEKIRLNNDLSKLETLKNKYDSNRKLIANTATIQKEGNVEDDRLQPALTILRETLTEDCRYWTAEKMREKIINTTSVDSDKFSSLRSEFDNIEELREAISTEAHRPGIPRAYLEGEEDNSRPIGPASFILEYVSFIALRGFILENRNDQRENLEDAIMATYDHDEIRSEMPSRKKKDYENEETLKQKWEDILDEFVRKRIQDLENARIDNIKPWTKSRTELAEELRELREEVKDELELFEEWETALESVDKIIESRRGTLQGLESEYKKWLKNIKDYQDSIEQNIGELENDQAKTSDELTTDNVGSRFKKIPIQNPDKLVSYYFGPSGDKDIVDKMNDLKQEYDVPSTDKWERDVTRTHLHEELCINDLLTQEIIEDSQILYDDITEIISLLDKKIVNDSTPEGTVLLPVGNPGDDWLEATDREELESWISEAGMDLMELNDSENIKDAVNNVPGTIRFVHVNTNVKYEEMPEYYTLLEWYKSGRLLDELGSNKTQSYDAVNWAYPELAPDIVELGKDDSGVSSE